MFAAAQKKAQAPAPKVDFKPAAKKAAVATLSGGAPSLVPTAPVTSPGVAKPKPPATKAAVKPSKPKPSVAPSKAASAPVKASSSGAKLPPAPTIELRKTKKPTKGMISAAGPDLEIGGSYQGGKYPKAAVHHTHLPEELDYGGHRRRQVLHHFSEVLRWHLEQNGKSPVEVQAQYLKRDGGFHLAVSANEHASQLFLANMTGEDLNAMYAAAAKSSAPERVQKSAAKLLRIQEQNEQRHKADSERETPQENEQDLADAVTLSALMRDRDKFSVVVNRFGRHAEQNLRKAFTDTFGTKGGDETDVAGTLIRCGACTAALGADEQLGKLLLRAGRKGHVSGKLYPAQADEADWTGYFAKIKSGTIRVETGNSRRRASTTPVAPARTASRVGALGSPSTPTVAPTAKKSASAPKKPTPSKATASPVRKTPPRVATPTAPKVAPARRKPAPSKVTASPIPKAPARSPKIATPTPKAAPARKKPAPLKVTSPPKVVTPPTAAKATVRSKASASPAVKTTVRQSTRLQGKSRVDYGHSGARKKQGTED